MKTRATSWIPYSKVISISNSLDNLVPIGTLNFCDIPPRISALGGVSPVISSKYIDRAWKWLDIDQFIHLMNQKANEIILSLQFLINYRFVMATYRYIKVELSSNQLIYICRVRIYTIPSDIQGARFFKEWRSNRPKHHNITKRFMSIWPDFIQILDYSNESWNNSRTVNLNKIKKNGLLLISAINPCGRIRESQALNYHINRWISNKSYSPNDEHFLKSDALSSKLQKIYNSIMSPDVSAFQCVKHKLVNHHKFPTTEEIILNLLNGENYQESGIKTQLYSFQKNSLAIVLEKEASHVKALVPNFIEVHSPAKRVTYYYDVLENNFYLNPEFYILPRGGILAENMGLGKTLICLSLVCLTKHEISSIPDNLILHDKTDLDIQEVILNNDNQYVPKESIKQKKIPKLVNCCIRVINKNSLPWKYFSGDLPKSIIKKLTSLPGSFDIAINHDESTRSSAQSTRKVTRRMEPHQKSSCSFQEYRTLLLCSTTLVIVPDNLFHQWNNEIQKHIVTDYLSVLFISNQFGKSVHSQNSTFSNELSANAKDLIKYDLIVLSNSLFSKQFDKENSDSPLKCIYWKRLIIDEGHSMSSKNSRTSLFCKRLFAERVWAVTGTPTSGLTNLHMDEEEDLVEATQSSKKNHYTIKTKFNEKEDLNKLGLIISNFLKIEPFFSSPKLWNNNIVKPLISNIYGSDISLSNLLNSIMVRHNLKDVEEDLKLPQLHHKAVFLKPSFHNKLSINLFTAVLAVNAVSSERTDSDYMFHPSNRQQLRRLITNLQRATFHWTGFKQSDVETLIQICESCLKKRKPDGSPFYCEHDLNLLKKSLEGSMMALDNQRWRTASILHEMNYYTAGLPNMFTESLGTGVLKSKSGEGIINDIGVFGAPHLAKVQEFFYKNRFTDMIDSESLNFKMQLTSRSFWNSYWEGADKRNDNKFHKYNASFGFDSGATKNDEVKVSKNADFNYDLSSNNSNKNVVFTPKKNIDNRNSSDFDDKRYLRRDGENGLRTTDSIRSSAFKDHFSFQSIKHSTILGTCSTKLSYIGSRLLEHQSQNIKSIVFFEFEDSAYYLAELLDILGLNYILYATFIKPTERASNLAEFSNFPSETNGGICLIMDLRLAAHGLTIIAATRVYFLSPVWQKSIEAQAVKRAHRIGQKKEVYVETLILEDTLEEEIYKTRSDIVDESIELAPQKKFVIDDMGMQKFILRHQFLEHQSSEMEYSPFVAPTTSKSIRSKKLNDLGYSLMNHEDSVFTRNKEEINRMWRAYVFSDDNLSKLNNSNNKKSNDIIKKEFVKNFVSSEATPDSNSKYSVRSFDTNAREPKRKKVRF